jgi:putative transposase
LARDIKAISSGWIHQEWPQHRDFAWQQGYAAFSVSLSALDDVIEYIENQYEHHRQRSFQEELRLMLDKHGIPYDEKYMWD